MVDIYFNFVNNCLCPVVVSEVVSVSGQNQQHHVGAGGGEDQDEGAAAGGR